MEADAVNEGSEVLAILKCRATEVTLSASNDAGKRSDLHEDRIGTSALQLCLTLDGTLRTAEDTVTWYPRSYADRGNKTPQLVDSAPWQGRCSPDGHITLHTSNRLLEGRLHPPCMLAGTSVPLEDTGEGLQRARQLVIRFDSVEMCLGRAETKEATWEVVLYLLKRLRLHAYKTNNNGHHITSSSETAVDFSTYLPFESVFSVCNYLPLASILALGSTSRTFQCICSDPYVWKSIYRRRFGTHTLLVSRSAATNTTCKEEGGVKQRWEQLKEGFSHSVDAVVSIYQRGLPLESPARKDEHNNSDSEKEEEEDWKLRYKLALQKDPEQMKYLVMNEGLFVLDGHTKNSAASGNVTRVQGARMRLLNGLVWAEMGYGSGSDYNSGAKALWVGRYDRETRRICWREKYGNHSGLFHYEGRVVDHHTIQGTYRWDTNGATGSFEYAIAHSEEM